MGHGFRTTGVPQDRLLVGAFEPRQSIVYRVDKDGASVSRSSPKRTDEENREVYGTVETVMSFEKQDQLQRHRNGSPK